MININKELTLMLEEQPVGTLTTVNELILSVPLPQYFNSLTPTNSEAINFFADRIISKDRKGISKIVNRIGISHYDVFEIARYTRAINPMDNFWLREDKSETFFNFTLPKVNELFKERNLAEVYSTGQNEKYYTKYQGRLGLAKKRLLGVTTDTESELAVYQLAKLLGVETCPVYRINKDVTFSMFLYNVNNETLIHARHLTQGKIDFEQPLLSQLIKLFPKDKNNLIKMAILDFITRQDDRHLSNLAFVNNRLYPLYDNGRSLFWEEDLDTIEEAINDPYNYGTSFGHIGTYQDDLVDLDLPLTNLINLNIPEEVIAGIMLDAGFKESKARLLTMWVRDRLNQLGEMGGLLPIL